MSDIFDCVFCIVSDIFDWVFYIVSDIFDWVFSIVSDIFDWVFYIVSDIFDWVFYIVSDIFDWVFYIVSDIFDWLKRKSGCVDRILAKIMKYETSQNSVHWQRWRNKWVDIAAASLWERQSELSVEEVTVTCVYRVSATRHNDENQMYRWVDYPSGSASSSCLHSPPGECRRREGEGWILLPVFVMVC